MINLEKAFQGMEELEISGAANSPLRQKKIEEAIRLSQKEPTWDSFHDGKTPMYFGVKNYAGFGDQNADCPEGLCPRHGTIVFSIERLKPVTSAGMYLLMLCAENSQVDVYAELEKFKKLKSNLKEQYKIISAMQEFGDEGNR